MVAGSDGGKYRPLKWLPDFEKRLEQRREGLAGEFRAPAALAVSGDQRWVLQLGAYEGRPVDGAKVLIAIVCYQWSVELEKPDLRVRRSSCMFYMI